MREEYVREMVGSLREWVARDFPSSLPPARLDFELSLRELLDLLIDAVPNDLAMSGALAVETMGDLQMTDREMAMAFFYDDEIQRAFRRREEPMAA